MTKMLAAVATAIGQIHCEEINIPNPTPGKVLVHTRLASICGSDLHIVYMGWNADAFPLPHGHPGHEGIGHVVDGGATSFLPGDLVLTAPNIWASRAFSEYQLIDPKYLLRLSDLQPMSHMLMAQQLGTVIFGCRLLPQMIGKTVVVIGQGSVGMFHNFVLRRLGAHKIIAIEPLPDRLSLGRDIFGIDEAIDVTGNQATEAVMDLTHGNGADVVVEAVGSVETLNQSLKLACPQGRIAAFGLPTTMDRIPFDWDTFFRKRLTIHTVHGAQEEPGLPDFQLAADFIARGELNVAPFVNQMVEISRVQDAFSLAHNKSKGVLKVTLTF